MSKLSTLEKIIPLCDFKIIVFTETWLIDSIKTSELGLYNFEVYRMDRNRSDVSRGGGVMIALDKQIRASEVQVECNGLEFLCVKFTIKRKKFILSTVYIPPSSDSSLYLSYTYILDELISRFPKSTFYYYWRL